MNKQTGEHKMRVAVRKAKKEVFVLFWQVKIGSVFLVGDVEHNKFSPRHAMSAGGKVVAFKDSDSVKLK